MEEVFSALLAENSFVFRDNDNIVAVATTPSTSSALNVIRCSGDSIFDVYKKITKKNKSPKPNSAYLCSIFDKQKNLLDKSVVTSFIGPNSFTGENIIEISVHGGVAVLNSVIDALLDCGCRLAEPGEFSYRAFINGKVDLIQAEAINALIKSNSNMEARYSLNSLLGKLSSIINDNIKTLTDLILYIEHELDFNDSELDFVTKKDYIKRVELLCRRGEEVLRSSFLATDKKTNISVCFAGKTNVGKSSLFNLLLGQKRAIVNKVSGTTRDVLSETITIDKTQISLIDTAGVRKTKNTVEKEGIARTKKAVLAADVLLFVDDKNPLGEFKKMKIKHKNVLFILNKKDAAVRQGNKNIIYTSCKNSFGIKRLLTDLSTKVLEVRDIFYYNKTFLLNLRQKKSLESYLKNLRVAIKAFNETKDPSIFINCLYKALDSLSSTTKPIEKKSLLNKVFRDFCVGK